MDYLLYLIALAAGFATIYVIVSWTRSKQLNLFSRFRRRRNN
ncbi:MAG: hypothetical protein ACOYVD_12465 [Bacillota bacterium]